MNVTGREVEFHWWNSSVPLLELWNSTGGTHDFHYWNSLSSLVREVISFYGLVELVEISKFLAINLLQNPYILENLLHDNFLYINSLLSFAVDSVDFSNILSRARVRENIIMDS